MFLPARVIAKWKNGAYVTSMSPTFGDDFEKLVEGFGLPDQVKALPAEHINEPFYPEKK